MASFKASHPKRHDLTSARTGGERRSLDVRAHLKGPWRRVVKKINVSSGLQEDDDDEDDDERPDRKIHVCGNSRMKRSRYVGALWAYV